MLTREEKLIKVLKELDSPNWKLTARQRVQAEQLINRCLDAFAADANDMGHCGVVQHVIDTGDAHAIKQPPRRLPFTTREIVE